MTYVQQIIVQIEQSTHQSPYIDGMVRAMTVAMIPTTPIPIRITHMISISDACKVQSVLEGLAGHAAGYALRRTWRLVQSRHYP